MANFSPPDARRLEGAAGAERAQKAGAGGATSGRQLAATGAAGGASAGEKSGSWALLTLDVLKADIEDHEWELFEFTEWSRVRIGNLLVEYHNDAIDHKLRQAGKGGFGMLQLHDQMARAENAGYRLYSNEPVCNGCPSQAEFSWVHRDWDPRCGFQEVKN